MVDSAEVLLRSHGLLVTAQRVAVLAALADCPHGTAEDLVAAVRGRIGTVSRQAVYDALATLSERGVIRRIQPARSPARYEDRVEDNHHHLVCRRCGCMVDVDCKVRSRPCLQVAEDHGFLIEEAEVLYWGFCPSCQASTSTVGGA